MNYCIYCGFPLKDGNSKCPRCGRDLPVDQVEPAETSQSDAATAPVSPNAETSPVETAPQYSQPSVQQVPPENGAQYAHNPNPNGPSQYMPGGYFPQNYGNGAGYSNYAFCEGPEMLSVGTIVGMLVLGHIPLVGWIIMLIWGFERSSRPNRRNLARGILIAKLIEWAVAILLWALMIMILGYSFANSYYYY
ncbi:hypothetical protein [uncultured Ruthenibacterium sp.]|uniref:hypothetical protein n=1 Tax=uncultured Ruthenibacterium sp. TaxID=1905347 RepID=UPI00349EF455